MQGKKILNAKQGFIYRGEKGKSPYNITIQLLPQEKLPDESRANTSMLPQWHTEAKKIGRVQKKLMATALA